MKWVDYFCSFINNNLSWRIPLFMQCIIGAILAVGSVFLPESPRCVISIYHLPNLNGLRWLIDTDKDSEGLKVLVDLHGGDPEDQGAKAEFNEIKDKVLAEVSLKSTLSKYVTQVHQRRTAQGRTYKYMWRRYKRRVLLAMSSQAFAQLVCNMSDLCLDLSNRQYLRTVLTVRIVSNRHFNSTNISP